MNIKLCCEYHYRCGYAAADENDVNDNTDDVHSDTMLISMEIMRMNILMMMMMRHTCFEEVSWFMVMKLWEL
jgi:hypothetical protein